MLSASNWEVIIFPARSRTRYSKTAMPPVYV
jgi:hypothetical protein